MRAGWEKSTLDRCSKRRPRTPAKLIAVIAIAAVTSQAAESAAQLAAAKKAFEAGKFQAAVDAAASASRQSPSLSDYAAWIRAQAEYRLKNYPEVANAVRSILEQDEPSSPLATPAVELGVQASLDSLHPSEGLDLLRNFDETLPQPQGDLLLAKCFQASGDLPHAAEPGSPDRSPASA